MTTSALRDGGEYVINGAKTLISNAGFADHYIVVARTGEAPGSRGLSAFLVDADAPGLSFGDPIEFIADHPAARMTFADCRLSPAALIGDQGLGFQLDLGGLVLFRYRKRLV